MDTLVFIAVILAATVGLILASNTVVDRMQRRSCPACREGTVLFLSEDTGLCSKHQGRWDRIARLERQMDWPDITAEQRQRGMDDLMRKLGGTLSTPPTEPGAASPKEGGIR